jgi:hypothetical protein
MAEQITSLYRSIDELPLRNFITCMVDDNLNALIKSGVASPEQLQDLWNEILSDYTDAVGNNENKLMLSNYKQLILLDAKLSIIETCIAILEKTYDETLANTLNELCGTKYKFQGENLQKELKSCFTRSRSIKIAFDLKMADFEAIRKKQINNERPTRKYFMSILIFLSNHAKYQITDEITVAEYCERLRLYNQHCESLKKP